MAGKKNTVTKKQLRLLKGLVVGTKTAYHSHLPLPFHWEMVGLQNTIVEGYKSFMNPLVKAGFAKMTTVKHEVRSKSFLLRIEYSPTKKFPTRIDEIWIKNHIAGLI